ncbi:AT-hook motif nuclear-localized protein 10-like [Bidens hawaiensis]|uniref:AT-hook motif nuclear-localized protein 10-like n=1 Tax=Bidens hawaiensis TaxID=980011 RepID=UPI004048FD6F
MNGSESGRLFQPSMPPVTSPAPAPAPATSQPPVSRYPSGVAGGYSVGSSDIMSGGGGGGGSLGFHQTININEHHGGGEITVKKRGRPRKYGPDGVISPSAARAVKLTPVSATASGTLNGAFEHQQQQPHSAAAVPPISAAPVSSVPMDEGFGSMKKIRGRPPGSTNKKQKRESFGSAGFGFSPHIIVVQPGEDVLNKIMSFSQNGPRAVCIMSGIGVITNVTLRQAATSGGTATYEGRFDILSLSGSFVLSEAYGQRTRTGGLSITLSGADGRVFGGVVAGLLVAASPVQVIVGSFLPENCKDPMPANHVEPSSVTPKVTPANHGTGPSSSPSHGTMSGSSDGPGSSMNRGNESSPQGMASMPWK